MKEPSNIQQGSCGSHGSTIDVNSSYSVSGNDVYEEKLVASPQSTQQEERVMED